jgi:hypothetical protein
VPTPFYHLSVAQDLLAHPELPPAVRSLLQEQRSAFFFGNTAPDVQVVSGQTRQATHFFDLPLLPGDPPAHTRLLAAHPALAHPGSLPASQAAFLGGYLCHLLADWIWVEEIFSPVFDSGRHWKKLQEPLYLHNVLRAYLDSLILPSLTNGVRSRLAVVSPDRWLPFVEDRYLRQWRDLLAEQLRPGAEVRTVEVFAARQGLPPEVYYDLLSSEERLDAELFAHLPRRALEAYRGRLVERSLELIERYFTG